MILSIGIGIVCFGIGMFIGSFIEKMKRDTGKDSNMLKDFIKNKQEQNRVKKEEKDMMNKLRQEARMEAMQNMKPELVQHMKEQELKKLTGEDKKEKLQKFADAFSMGGSFNSSDKINNMLGTQQTQQPQQYNTQQPGMTRRRVPRKRKSEQSQQEKSQGVPSMEQINAYFK